MSLAASLNPRDGFGAAFLAVVGGHRRQLLDAVRPEAVRSHTVLRRQGLHHGIRPAARKVHIGRQLADAVRMAHHVELEVGMSLEQLGNPFQRALRFRLQISLARVEVNAVNGGVAGPGDVSGERLSIYRHQPCLHRLHLDDVALGPGPRPPSPSSTCRLT